MGQLLPWLLLLLGFVAYQFYQYGWVYAASDDSYIYVGYVKRALTPPYQLFSYNPGEHSAGTTGITYYYLLIVVSFVVRLVTFFLPLELSLLLGMYLTNGALLLLTADRYLRCWRGLVPRSTPPGAVEIALLFLLFCAHPQFLWGVFAGMENPLAALLVLLLLDRLLQRATFWQPALVAALLCATRPETTIVLWSIPVCAALGQRPAPRAPKTRGAPARRGLLVKTLAGYAVWAAALGLLVAPCYLLTGRVFPSAMGTRIQLAPLLDLAALKQRFAILFMLKHYWDSQWLIPVYIVLFLGLCTGFLRRQWSVLWTGCVLLLFFVLRALVGIRDFNIESRYVSYLWPLYALAIGACVRSLGQPLAERLERVGQPVLRGIAVALFCGAALLLPLRVFQQRFDWHVRAMNAIVVEPSRWMRANLPKTARICMEPAGAIRVFTDFYLVDGVGLTTDHMQSNRGNYLDFLHAQHVDYVFDRPGRVAVLLATGYYQQISNWAKEVDPFGDIYLYHVEPMNAVTITGLTCNAAESSSAVTTCDNNPSRARTWCFGGGFWYAGQHMPAMLQVEFTPPVLVDGLALTLAGADLKTSPPGAYTPLDYRFEGKVGRGWATLDLRNATTQVAADGREIWTMALPNASNIQGLRFVCTRTRSGFAPIVYELTLLRDQKPYVWLWPK